MPSRGFIIEVALLILRQASYELYRTSPCPRFRSLTRQLDTRGPMALASGRKDGIVFPKMVHALLFSRMLATEGHMHVL